RFVLTHDVGVADEADEKKQPVEDGEGQEHSPPPRHRDLLPGRRRWWVPGGHRATLSFMAGTSSWVETTSAPAAMPRPIRMTTATRSTVRQNASCRSTPVLSAGDH